MRAFIHLTLILTFVWITPLTPIQLGVLFAAQLSLVKVRFL